MNKLVVKITVALSALFVVTSTGMALAAPKKTTTVKPKAVTVTKPFYCGTSPYDRSYAAIYQYPSGSYWQGQIAAYPDYYAANNAYYQTTYGC